MKIYRVVLFSLAMAFAPNNKAFCQKKIDAQTNSWYMYFGNHLLSERWGLHTEYQFRRTGLGQDWQQSLLRLGADYYAQNGLQITAGYAWIQSFPYGKQPIAYSFDEHRIWQQLILAQQTGRLYFHHRYRLEQRFLERKTLNDQTGTYDRDEFVFRQRARYRFLVSVPLNHPTMMDKTVFLAFYDEAFIGFGKGIQKNVLDQNRLYAAVGYRFSQHQNLQIGYLNQYIIKADGIQAERNHNIQIGYTYNWDLR